MNMVEQRRFPVRNDVGGHINGRSAVPWSFARRVYADYLYLCGLRGQGPRSLEQIAQSDGGWGWSEMMEIMVDAEEDRVRDRSEGELTTKARNAFGEMTGASPT